MYKSLKSLLLNFISEHISQPSAIFRHTCVLAFVSIISIISPEDNLGHSGTSDKGHSEIRTTSDIGQTKNGRFVCKLTSERRTTSLQGTTEMSQCVHYSEVPLYLRTHITTKCKIRHTCVLAFVSRGRDLVMKRFQL